MGNVFRFSVSLIIALQAASSFAGDLSKAIRDLKLEELHEKAPEAEFTDAAGKTNRLSSFRGKAVLLHFWASWCDPCREELPDLVKFSKLLDPKRWVFLPISVNEPAKKADAIRFLKGVKPEVSFYILSGTEGAEKYKTWGIPVTYLISPDGEIVARALGCKEWTPAYTGELNELFSPKTGK